MRHVSKAIVTTPTLLSGTYFLCPDNGRDDCDSGGLHLHISDVRKSQCDIRFGAPTSSAIRFDKDAATRMAAFMTELANVLK